MTEVYLVMCWNYESSGPIAIWSTREAAEEDAQRLRDAEVYGAQYGVSVFTLDERD